MVMGAQWWPLAPIPFSDIYEALYRGSWRSIRTAIEGNMLEGDKLEHRKTSQKGAFRGWANPRFNHFRLQTAPSLAKLYFRQMLLNGIGARPAGRHGFDDRAAVIFSCRFFSGFWSHRRVRVRAAAVTKSAHTAGLPSKTVRRSQVLRWASKTNDIFQTSLADIRLYSP